MNRCGENNEKGHTENLPLVFEYHMPVVQQGNAIFFFFFFLRGRNVQREGGLLFFSPLTRFFCFSPWIDAFFHGSFYQKLAVILMISPGRTGSSKPMLCSLKRGSSSCITRISFLSANSVNPPAKAMALRMVRPG